MVQCIAELVLHLPVLAGKTKDPKL